MIRIEKAILDRIDELGGKVESSDMIGFLLEEYLTHPMQSSMIFSVLMKEGHMKTVIESEEKWFLMRGQMTDEEKATFDAAGKALAAKVEEKIRNQVAEQIMEQESKGSGTVH